MNTPFAPLLMVSFGSVVLAVISARRGWFLPEDRRIPAVAVGLACLVGAAYAARTWHVGVTAGINQGFYANAAWNMMNGRFYASDWFDSILSYHALLTGVWFYMPALAFGHHFAFGLLHQVYLALGALCVGLLAEHLTGRRSWGLTVVVLFLFNAYITSWFLVLFLNDAPVFALLALAFLLAEKGRRLAPGLLVMAAAGLLEDIALGLLLYTLIEWALKRRTGRRPLFSGWVSVALIVYLSIYYGVLRPTMPDRGSEVQHLAVMSRLFTEPLVALSTVLTKTKIGFLCQVLQSTAALPLLAPLALLVAVPDVALALLTPTFEVHSIATPYLPGLAVSLFIGACYGLGRVEGVLARHGATGASIRGGLQAGLICFALASQLLFNHTVPMTWMRGEIWFRPPYFFRALSMIPEGARVATNTQVFYGMAYDRRCLLLDDVFLPWTAEESERKAMNVDWLVADPTMCNSGHRFIREQIATGRYRVLFESEREIVARRISGFPEETTGIDSSP